MFYLVNVPTKENPIRLMLSTPDIDCCKVVDMLKSMPKLRNVGWITYKLSRIGLYKASDYLANKYGVEVVES